MSNLVSYTHSDSIANIVMDDGKVNVMSVPMLSDLNDAFDRAQADKAVVVLTGRPGAFSAGFDLKVLSRGGSEAVDLVKTGLRLAERLLSFAMPVVAGCTGHAVAMGVFLLLSVDLRIGIEGPYKIQANEVAIGLTMPQAAIELCRHRLAPPQFNLAVNNAEVFSPEEAVRAGFLDRVVAAADLPDATQTAAAMLSKLNMPAHTATKLRTRASLLNVLHSSIDSDDALRVQ